MEDETAGKRRPRGRPSKLNDEVQAAFVEALESGLYVEDACVFAGVSKVTYYDWVKRGEAGEEPYAGFMNAVEKATTSSAKRALETVRLGEQGWQGSAWFLERRHYQKWGRRDPDYDLRVKQLKADLEKTKTENEVLKAKLKLLDQGTNPDALNLQVLLPSFAAKEEEP